MLVDAIGQVVRYDKPDESGETERWKAEQRGEFIPPPEVPPAGQRLWEIFWELRPSSEWGLAPGDLWAWTQLTGESLAPWEFRGLLTLDVERRRALGEKKETPVKEDVQERIKMSMRSFGARRVEKPSG